MVYLYSGFHEHFAQDLAAFTGKVDRSGPVALLLQGGEGHEDFLDLYLRPLRGNGIREVAVIVPEPGGCRLGAESMALIERATGLFIGGGDTARYAAIYCIEPVRALIRRKRAQGMPIAGLSAGAIILNDRIWRGADASLSSGLGAVENLHVFPHFEEDGHAYKLLRLTMDFAGRRAYGLETSAFLAVGKEGRIQRGGKGRVWQARYDGARRLSLEVLS